MSTLAAGVSSFKDLICKQDPIWKSYCKYCIVWFFHFYFCIVFYSLVYQLQKEAPIAKAIFSLHKINDIPPQYGLEYHGKLHRKKCSDLLSNDGEYLVRKGDEQESHWTLSLK